MQEKLCDRQEMLAYLEKASRRNGGNQSRTGKKSQSIDRRQPREANLCDICNMKDSALSFVD